MVSSTISRKISLFELKCITIRRFRQIENGSCNLLPRNVEHLMVAREKRGAISKVIKVDCVRGIRARNGFPEKEVLAEKAGGSKFVFRGDDRSIVVDSNALFIQIDRFVMHVSSYTSKTSTIVFFRCFHSSQLPSSPTPRGFCCKICDGQKHRQRKREKNR
jgi:hypothetical protein